MASTLYISLPSRVAAQHRPDWAGQPLAFALISAEGRLQQQGQASLSELKALSAAAKQLAFILAASDTSLLSTKVPPMSASKLKQALPNLLEDQLISDPADLIMVNSAIVDGDIHVAVADKAWLETLAKLIRDWPGKKVSAYPAQLALTFERAANPAQQTATAFLEEKDGVLELSLRNGQHQGLGLSLESTDPATVLAMLSQLSQSDKITTYVAAATQDAYQQALVAQGLQDKIELMPVSWLDRVAGIGTHPPDLMSGVAAEHMAGFDWSKWRWALALGVALLLVNVLALNFEWLSMKREAQEMQKTLLQVYRSTYPKETVIVDPMKQMQQKVNTAKRAAGQFAANDFAVMAAQFSQIWDRAGVPGGVASIEYKERALFVRTKPNIQIPLEALRTALAEQSMQLNTSADGMLRITFGGKN